MCRANEETILMCQIDPARAWRTSARSWRWKVSTCFIGPNDMTQDYGILNQFGHPDIVAAFEKVIAATEENGKVGRRTFRRGGAAETVACPRDADEYVEQRQWAFSPGASEIAGLRGRSRHENRNSGRIHGNPEIVS